MLGQICAKFHWLELDTFISLIQLYFCMYFCTVLSSVLSRLYKIVGLVSLSFKCVDFEVIKHLYIFSKRYCIFRSVLVPSFYCVDF